MCTWLMKHKKKIIAGIVGTIAVIGLHSSKGCDMVFQKQEGQKMVTACNSHRKAHRKAHEVSRNESSITEKTGDLYTLTAYSGPQFTQVKGEWYEVDYKVESLSYLYSTAYADSFFSGPGDGLITKTGGIWGDVQGAATGVASATTSAMNATSQKVSGTFTITRAAVPFNTSTILSEAVIVSATLQVYATAMTDTSNDGTDWISVVQTFTLSSLTLGDNGYPLIGDAIDNPTEGSDRITVSAIATGSYDTFTLNATGLGWVGKDSSVSSCGTIPGYTCLGLREGHDQTDTPVGAETKSTATFSTSEQAGTSQDPVLTVNYTIPTSGLMHILNGTVHINSGIIHIN